METTREAVNELETTLINYPLKDDKDQKQNGPS